MKFLKTIFIILTYPAFTYLMILRRLWRHLQARRAVKRLAKSKKPKDQLIRWIVYKTFRM